MFGTFLNAAGIVVGALAGVLMREQLRASTQSAVKVGLGAFTVWIGLKLTWTGLHGTFWEFGQRLLIVVVAMTLGRLLGAAMRIQASMNQLGRYAKEMFGQVQPDSSRRMSDGFVAAAVLFCAAPLAVLGSVQDGLNGNFQPLLVKSVMDGLATMALVKTFGGGVVLAVVPVVAYEFSLTRVAQLLVPFLQAHGLVDSVNAACGILIFSVALVIFQLKKIELGDYLPAVLLAPALTSIWR